MFGSTKGWKSRSYRMLELIEKDIPTGAEMKLYLISGDTIVGRLMEVGAGYIIVEESGKKKRFFEQMIGGWDIVGATTPKEKIVIDNSKNKMTGGKDSTEDRVPIVKLAKAFIDSLTDEELSYVFAPNAKIISADRKNVVIRTNETGDSFSVPFKYIASKGIVLDIESYFLSGEESQNSSIPVYVGFYVKDKTPVYPNIIIEPGTMQEYCALLSDQLLSSNSLLFLVKNLLFILWRGCKNKSSKDSLRSFQAGLRGAPEKDFLSEIDEQIRVYSEKGKDINPLLTRKAQWLSSKNKYQEAADAYVTLINSLCNIEGASPQSISHNYTQLALLQMRLNDYDSARSSVNSAMEYNPENALAQSLLNRLDSPEGIERIEVETLQGSISKIRVYTDSVLQDDMKRHAFVDPDARAKSEAMTVIVAERLLSLAESEESENAYLEAAKAYSLVQLSEADDIFNYAKALFGYASSKSRFFYNFLINKSNKLTGKELIKSVDGAFCYFVSAINFGDILGQSWSTFFRDYLRMKLSVYAFQHNVENVGDLFELPFDEFIRANRLQQDIDFLLECSDVLVSLGARCPVIKDNLHGVPGQSMTTIIELLNSLIHKEQFEKQICQKNRCPQIKFDGPAELFIAQIIDHRVKRLATLKTKINSIKNKSPEALFEAKTARDFMKLKKISSILTTTDIELSSDAEALMATLPIFKGRTLDERRILVPSIKAEISNNLESISGYSSYLCSDLLRDLWQRILESKYLSVDEATFALQSELMVFSDGAIVTDNMGNRTIPLSVSNEGRSTIDSFKAIVSFSEIKEQTFEYESEKRLSPGEAVTIFVDVPKIISDLVAYDCEVSVSGLIINSWSSSKTYHLTAHISQNVSFRNKDIKWNFDAKETRDNMFKGRRSVIEKLLRTFTSNERSRIPIVFGLTRTGKSSILLHLKKSLSGMITEIGGANYTIVPVYIDLSTMKSQYNDHESFMTQLCLKCNDEFCKYGINVMSTKWNSLPDLIDRVNSKLLYPVFMLDEFSWIKPVIQVEGNDFLKIIREYSIEQRAGFIYAGTYDILKIIRSSEVNPSGTFMNIDEIKIYNIEDANEAEALMRVMEPQLVFTTPAIRLIHEYSGDVPYWIQLICYHCARYAISNNMPVIGTKEIEEVIKGILGGKCNGVSQISDVIFTQQQLLPSDPKETKALLFSIAYLMKDNNYKTGVSWSRLKEFWAENGYSPKMESIVRAKELLEERLGLLSQEIEGTPVYYFSVGLFRRWCAQKDVFCEFDKTNNLV